jgi:DNA-binding transcriptional MerR regulator
MSDSTKSTSPRAPLTTSGVARALRWSENTVRVKARRGELPFTETASGIRLFQPEDIERIAAERQARRDGGEAA